MNQDNEESKTKYIISGKKDNVFSLELIPPETGEEENVRMEDIRLPKIPSEAIKSHIRKNRQRILIILLVLILILLSILFRNIRRYRDYDVTGSYERTDGVETSYVDFGNNLLRYSKDGAFYTGYDGELIWNYTYEMSNPAIDMCEDYLLIYDKGGSQLSILSSGGFKQMIKTAMPIVDAHIARQGTVGILMQDGGEGHIQLCDRKGTVLASGVLYMSNSGYPLSIDISDNGENLAVSQLNLNNGGVDTTIAFYNFGNAGRDKKNNIVRTYSYKDRIFPKIVYMEGGNAVAFGSGEVVLYNNNSKVSVKKEYFTEGEIKKIFYNSKHFGYICDATSKDGEQISLMNIYNDSGLRRVSRAVESTYTDVRLMENDEVFLTNGNDTSVYTMFGIEKFRYSFKENTYTILPGDGYKRYVLVQDGVTNMIRLR